MLTFNLHNGAQSITIDSTNEHVKISSDATYQVGDLIKFKVPTAEAISIVNFQGIEIDTDLDNVYENNLTEHTGEDVNIRITQTNAKL